jgi:hypothetical protein
MRTIAFFGFAERFFDCLAAAQKEYFFDLWYIKK